MSLNCEDFYSKGKLEIITDRAQSLKLLSHSIKQTKLKTLSCFKSLPEECKMLTVNVMTKKFSSFLSVLTPFMASLRLMVLNAIYMVTHRFLSLAQIFLQNS